MEFLKSLFKSPVTKEVLRLILAALAGSLSSGCGLVGLAAPDSAAAAKFECQQAVFAELVPAPVAEDLALAGLRQDFDYIVAVLLQMEVSPEDILQTAEDFRACDAEGPAAPAPAAPVNLLGT